MPNTWVTVLLSDNTIAEERWRVIGDQRGDWLVGTLPLRDGWTVGVIWRQVRQTEADRAYVATLLAEVATLRVRNPADTKFLNLIHVGAEPNGRPLLVEIIPGREHLGHS